MLDEMRAFADPWISTGEYQKLGEAEILDARGEQGISHTELMKKLKNKIK